MAPLSLIAEQPRVRPLRQLALWGAIGPRMRGLVDVLARDELREDVLDSLARWLRGNDEWDLLRVVRPQVGSLTPGRLRNEALSAGWTYAPYSNLRSTTFQLDLPESLEAWESALTSKARRNLRWQARKFAAFRGGRVDAVAMADEVPEALDALEKLLHRRWGDKEVYFRGDPSFRPLLDESVAEMGAAGSAWVSLARDDAGIQGVLVSLAQNGYAMSLLVAATADPDYRPFSLGSHVFDAGIREAVRRGCHNYDFLWVGGYKESFWHATPRHLESAMVGRGVIGRLAARVLARRS